MDYGLQYFASFYLSENNEYQVYENPRDITVTEEYAKNECNSNQPDAGFEVAQALDINLCRICRSVLLADAKSLVAQAVAGKSYGDIIVEMLNIPVRIILAFLSRTFLKALFITGSM